jgi:CGNR zinc finger protein
LRATAEQLPGEFTPFREALALTMTLRSPVSAPRGDPTNFLGGVADVLQRKPEIESLGELASVLVYENDLQLRRIEFRQETSPEVGYELRFTSLGGPDLVERRIGPMPGLEIAIHLFEIDELALTFVNAFEGLGRRGLAIQDTTQLLSFMQLQRAIPDSVLNELRERLGESEVETLELFARAKAFSAALFRLLRGQRSAEDASLITELRRATAKYEWVDLDADVDLPLANIDLNGSEAIAVLAPILRSALRLLLPSVRGRIHECADQECRRLFLDRTKNGTKTWCSMASCGNRAKQRAWRIRRTNLEETALPYVVA